MKRILLIAAAAVLLAACGGNAHKKTAAADKTASAASGQSETTAAVPDMHTAETSLDYEGTYTGTFPAADGPGIEMRLELKHDGRFALHMKYIDRNAEFDRKGAYTVKGNLLTLTSDDGNETDYYKVEENRLRKLDADRQPVTGELAAHYVLTKKTHE